MAAISDIFVFKHRPYEHYFTKKNKKNTHANCTSYN